MADLLSYYTDSVNRDLGTGALQVGSSLGFAQAEPAEVNEKSTRTGQEKSLACDVSLEYPVGWFIPVLTTYWP